MNTVNSVVPAVSSFAVVVRVKEVAFGAEILEFHVVFHREIFGPDSKASLTIEETKQLVKAVNEIQDAIINPLDKNSNEIYIVFLTMITRRYWYYDLNGKIKYYDNETDNYKQNNFQLHFIHQVNSKFSFNLSL